MTSAPSTEPQTGDPLAPLPLITGHQTNETLTRTLLAPAFASPGWMWWCLFLVCGAGTTLLLFCIVYTFIYGIGTWGNDIPNAWAFGIANFVWWIGFAHAGTLISAILVLFQQKWRASINRFAETMTLCAVMQAGLYPILHLGRPEFAYWLVPYPSTLGVWPQFRSALTWDVVAVMTYLLVSAAFWYVGMIPDLAAARDHAPTKRRRVFYGLLALGWRNSAEQWHHWREAYLLLAALATALVISVESIVSFDFSTGQLPGWHSTIFPPYFVASAMFSGFALLLVLLVPVRRAYRLEHVITEAHLSLLNTMLLLFSFFVIYGYLQENFFSWYSADIYERAVMSFKRTGFYGAIWILMIVCTALAPQAMWSSRLRRSPLASFVVGGLVVIGAWCEQFTHVVPPLSHSHIPATWREYAPSWVDLGLLAGTICFFGLLYLVLFKFLPLVPVADVKDVHHKLTEGHYEDEREPPVAAASGE